MLNLIIYKCIVYINKSIYICVLIFVNIKLFNNVSDDGFERKDKADTC